MLDENWATLLFICFLAVAVGHSFLASCTTIYYKQKSSGHLSHSQLRIKQGSASVEHRLNVFAQSLVFSFLSIRIYFFAFLLWLTSNGILYLLAVNNK